MQIAGQAKSSAGGSSVAQYEYYVTADSWSDLVHALESGAYATVFIPNGLYTCTDNEANPIIVHTDVKRISGESMNGCIIDAACNNNPNIQDFITGLSKECLVEEITVKNFGLVAYYCWTGAYDGSFTFFTKFINCKVMDMISNNATGFRYGTLLGCEGINDSSVGVYGIGRFASQCYNISNCRTAHVYTGIQGSDLVIGNNIQNAGNAIQQCNIVESNLIVQTNRGIYGCTYVGTSNKVYHATKPYDSSRSDQIYMDNIDNTKTLKHIYSDITTGTEREVTWQDKDGTVELVKPVIVNADFDNTINTGDTDTDDAINALIAALKTNDVIAGS